MDGQADKLAAAFIRAVEHEAPYYELCPYCGQAFDGSNLGDVVYHIDDDHKPMPVH